MPTIQQEIASRVKDMREVCEMSVQQLADKLDVDTETYTKYESGEIDIPASILYEISLIFDVDTSLLLTGEDRREAYDYENLASNFMHKTMESFIVTVMPRNDNYIPEPNYHKGFEFVYILEGTLRIYIKDNVIDLNEGDSIYFDSTHKHSMVAVGDKKAKFLDVLNVKG